MWLPILLLLPSILFTSRYALIVPPITTLIDKLALDPKKYPLIDCCMKPSKNFVQGLWFVHFNSFIKL